MPITTGSVWPIAAHGGQGGTHAAFTFRLPLDASETVNPGDILVVTTGTRDLSVNNNPTGATTPIYGVSALSGAGQKVSGATVVRDTDQIILWPAFVNMLFTGNLVGGAATDHTGAYATSINLAYGTVACTDPAPDIAALNFADTTNPVAYTLWYVRQRPAAANPTGSESGVGVANPRLAFHFVPTTTVWGAGLSVA